MVLGWLLESSVTLTTINTITHVSNQIVCNRLITDQVFNWHASLQFVPHIRSVFLPGQCPCWFACCKQITAWMSKRQLRLKEAFVHKGRGIYRGNERRPYLLNLPRGITLESLTQRMGRTKLLSKLCEPLYQTDPLLSWYIQVPDVLDSTGGQPLFLHAICVMRVRCTRVHCATERPAGAVLGTAVLMTCFVFAVE